MRFALFWAAIALAAQSYRMDPPRPGTVVSFQVVEDKYLSARKANGETFRVWHTGKRYILQEGTDTPVEYVDAVTRTPVLPSVARWLALRPRNGEYLGHRYIQTSEPAVAAPLPAKTRIVALRPDLWIGPAHNSRQKDETRRYDGSDYEYIPFTRADYQALRDAGATVVNAKGSQVAWAAELGMYYWGDAETLPFPEMLYRSQYLGPTIFVDEPAVGTRDHHLRPRLAKDAVFRREITPRLAFDRFVEHFAEVIEKGAPWILQRTLAKRADVDPGSLSLPQANLYSWETMVSTATHQLSAGSVQAIVWEPAGRVGSRRTIPEWNMAFEVAIPPGNPRHLIDPFAAFLRGAARAHGKQWGISIYGAVDRPDAPAMLTRAYDLGATRFHFWDSYQLACVPFGEVLALTRTLSRHAAAHPKRDLTQLRNAATTAFVVPVGFDLGHVHSGKGLQWGLPELNLERGRNRALFHHLFSEIESALRRKVAFDIVPDDVETTGYARVVRIEPRPAAQRKDGPRLSVEISRAGNTFTAVASVPDRVFNTRGANRSGVYENDEVFWELYGPAGEDYQTLIPRAPSRVSFDLTAPGAYRLRAAVCDLAGRVRVAWKDIIVEEAAR